MMKKFINFSIAGFVLAGFFLVLGKDKWFPEFYMPLFMGVISFLSAFLIILPRLIFKPQVEDKERTLVNLQGAMSLSLILNGLGGLGLFQLYKVGVPYDKILHLVVSLILTFAVSNFMFSWYEKSLRRVLATAFILIISVGFVWEFLEFFSDVLFKTQSFGIYGMDTVKDTLWDITLNLLGAISGVLVFKNLTFRRFLDIIK